MSVRMFTPGYRSVWLAGLFIIPLCHRPIMHAQSPGIEAHRAAASENAGTGGFRIAGRLVNAISGEPVRQATVAVLAIEDSRAIKSVISDSDGRFALDGLPRAKYQLTASKRGLRTSFYDEHDEYSSAVVTGEDQDTSHLTFRMTPGASVLGVISGDDGEPVEGARVMLFQRPRHPGPGARIVQQDVAVTDDTGAYEFSDLSAGEYLIAVIAEPWYAMHGGGKAGSEMVNPALDVAYPVTYYDSTTDEATARAISLSGGSRVTADISLNAVPALHLTIPTPRRENGSIARPELQQTVFGTSISVESSGFIDSLQSGKTEIAGVAPGHYEITQGEPPRMVDLDVSASQLVDAGGGAPASQVAGTLRFQTGMPVTEEVNMTLDRRDNEPGANQFVTAARGGRFKFENVPPGSWLLWAAGTKQFTVLATGTGNQQHPGNIVNTRDRAIELAVTLSTNEARIEGLAAKDGNGLAGVMVMLAPRDPASWWALMRRDQSDTDGSFTLRDVAPGQYTVVAIEDGWELDWSRPEAMARYLQQGTAVNVTAHSGNLIRLTSPIAVQAR